MSRRYTLFVFVTFSISTIINAEPPVPSKNEGKSIVSQRLLNKVADILANNGDGSASPGEGTRGLEGPSIVDEELLDRIARIIGQNDGQLAWSHKARAKPSESLSLPRNDNEFHPGYGVPPVEVPKSAKELAGPQFELFPPEPVPRIASFDWRDEDEGYSGSAQPSPDSYSDSKNLYQGNGKIQLGEPEQAARIASFNIEGEKAPAPFASPQNRGGYSNNYR